MGGRHATAPHTSNATTGRSRGTTPLFESRQNKSSVYRPIFKLAATQFSPTMEQSKKNCNNRWGPSLNRAAAAAADAADAAAADASNAGRWPRGSGLNATAVSGHVPSNYVPTPPVGHNPMALSPSRHGNTATTSGGVGGSTNKKRGRDWDDDVAAAADASYLPRKDARYLEGSDAPRTRSVRFSAAEPKIHYFDRFANEEEDGGLGRDGAGDMDASEQRTSENNTSRLTEELTILSTTHGRARRQLRDITKHDLQTAVKYGTKTRANMVRGEQRWKFTFGNVVYITDATCTREITSYWQTVHIQPATITQKMREEHEEAVRILRDEPFLTTTHSIIIVDQSGSMREADVKGFRSRSEAAYGTLALDYIAEQLYQRGDEFLVDAVTIIEMNDSGSIFINREPLDWILFNNLLLRQKQATPRSHGNYFQSLKLAQTIIKKELEDLAELDDDDIPAFMLVLLSDGRPSDLRKGAEAKRRAVLSELATSLGSKLTVFGMGIGAIGSEFDELNALVTIAKDRGSTDSQFVHAGLSTASISTAFSSMATSMTTTRTALLTVSEGKQKTEKAYTLRAKDGLSTQRPSRQITRTVSRWKYDREKGKETSKPWSRQKFKDPKATGFEVEIQPFAKGAERLAYRFYEIKKDGPTRELKRVGKMMVAKESKYIEDEGEKEKFHENFCRVQLKARNLSEEFNKAVHKAPKLKPKEDEVAKPPKITFLKCRVYEYEDDKGEVCGLLVEDYLMGKFTKYNGNNGYVIKRKRDGRTIDLEIGEVYLTDFVQAFSHWVYHKYDHKMLVCDLQTSILWSYLW